MLVQYPASMTQMLPQLQKSQLHQRLLDSLGSATLCCAVLCRFEGVVPSVHGEKGAAAVAELGQQVGALVDEYVTALEARKLKEGIRLAMAISSLGGRPSMR